MTYDKKKAAQLIREELKREFSGTKFSVVGDRNSAIVIKWQDGPTEDQVNHFVSKYRDADHNLWQDVWESGHATAPFYVEYLQLERSYSIEALQAALDETLETMCIEAEDTPHGSCVNRDKEGIQFVRDHFFVDGGVYSGYKYEKGYWFEAGGRPLHNYLLNKVLRNTDLS